MSSLDQLLISKEESDTKRFDRVADNPSERLVTVNVSESKDEEGIESLVPKLALDPFGICLNCVIEALSLGLLVDVFGVELVDFCKKAGIAFLETRVIQLLSVFIASISDCNWKQEND